MSRDFSEMLETTTPTDEVMDVDMPFLDAYRHGGSSELQRLQAQEADAPQAEAQPRAAEPQAGTQYDDGDRETEALGPDSEPASAGSERAGGTSRRGGTGGASAAGGAAGEMTPGGPAEASASVAAPARETLADAGAEVGVSYIAASGPDLETEPETPASLQLTDHQEVVQGASSARGGSGGADDTEALPQSGFRLSGVKSQPHIKSLPDVIMSVLREQLRSAAVRELSVSDADAREFSRRLSQGTLVTAFLAAQLDLRITADAATQRAAELFRSRDPLLGSVAARLERLEQLENDQSNTLHRLGDELAMVRQTGATIEQAVAYSIADRTENFLRGSHNVHDAPITHKDALFVRDRVREATRKQERLEREREGRPIR
ncbi:hypothetical protein ACFS27_13565 [Promicromonospora vindobonensis]|uniref:Toxic anion resistance protein TelA n=1 Tax=Promicromonospora vindobonensis TaxID=195748 RepID=A0ABW5VUF5_9MICO